MENAGFQNLVPNSMHLILPGPEPFVQASSTGYKYDIRKKEVEREREISTCVWIASGQSRGRTKNYLDRCSLGVPEEVEGKFDQVFPLKLLQISNDVRTISRTAELKKESFRAQDLWVLLALREVAERRSDPYERVHCELKKRLTQHATDISNASSAISKALLELSRLRAESAKEEIDRKIISSVKEGNLQEARQMLKVAVTISPEEKYKRFLKVIAPPEIVSIKKPETEGIEKAVALLKQRGAEFVNKWIVISNGQPVELANSYAELHKKYKGKDVIITRVV